MPEPEEPEQRRKIFVGSLVFKSDEKDLKEFYGQFGEITDCVVMKVSFERDYLHCDKFGVFGVFVCGAGLAENYLSLERYAGK